MSERDFSTLPPSEIRGVFADSCFCGAIVTNYRSQLWRSKLLSFVGAAMHLLRLRDVEIRPTTACSGTRVYVL